MRVSRLHARRCWRMPSISARRCSWRNALTCRRRRRSEAAPVLAQECVDGIGVCVSAVFNNGDPVAMFAYERVRDAPLSGGVSVLRKSIRLDERLNNYVTALLNEIKWHGVAMVEFKYDES